MQELIAPALALIVIAVLFMIGASIVLTTQDVTNGVVNESELNSTLLSDTSTATANGITTFVNFIPILAMVIVGGLALGYLLNFGRGKAM